MKSQLQTQSTSFHPATSSNSLLEAFSRDAVSPVLPSAKTNTATESEAFQQRKTFLRMILATAIAVLDNDDFDPIDASTTHQRPPHLEGHSFRP
jgi:hypothetical protein